MQKKFLCLITALLLTPTLYAETPEQASSQANRFIAQVQTITAAVENFVQGTGNYAGITQAQVSSLLPANGLITPWSGTITFTATPNGYAIAIHPAPPASVCALVTAKLSSSTQYLTGNTCTTVTYTARF